jgi:hypothetical protein
VIRQRARSDHDYPDIGHFPDTGQQMALTATMNMDDLVPRTRVLPRAG